MDRPENEDRAQGVAHDEQASDPRLDKEIFEYVKKTFEHVKELPGITQTVTRVLEELKNNEGYKSKERMLEDTAAQDKLKELEEDKKILQAKVASLDEALQSESRKTQELHKMMIKVAGHTDGTPNDTEIQVGFEKLKNDIYQLVMSHFTRNITKFSTKTSPDIGELINRAKIATYIYDRFFSDQSRVYGVEKLLEHGLACFEKEVLHRSGTDIKHDEAFEWRARTVQICRALKMAGKYDRAKEEAEVIWREISPLCHHPRKIEREVAIRDLETLCRSALDLTILLRSTKTEFDWEQNPQASARVYKSKDMEVLGTYGSEFESGRNFVAERIVFGGLVRGDAKTGRFRDGRTRLLKSSVVIK